MIATPTAELLHRLQKGMLDPTDTIWLERIPADDL